MPRRSMVGLLAAVGAAMSALVGFARRRLVWAVIAEAAAATGLAAYGVLVPIKKAHCVPSLTFNDRLCDYRRSWRSVFVGAFDETEPLLWPQGLS